MLIESPRLGRLEVNEGEVVTFPDGLLGFREFRRYVFRETQPGSVLMWMQSLDMPALAFVVMDPRLIKPDYQVRVTQAQLEPVGIEDTSRALVYVTLTIPPDITKMTANLQGPLVVSAERRLGAQIVLNEEGVTTKFPVMEALRSRRPAGAPRG